MGKKKSNIATAWECSTIPSLPHSPGLGGAQAQNEFAGSPSCWCILLNVLLQERAGSRDSQDFPACPTEAPLSHKTAKILSLQAVIFKPVFLNTKCLSLSLKQQPRNEGNGTPFPQVLLRFFLGRTGRNLPGVAEKPVRDTQNLSEVPSPHTFPSFPPKALCHQPQTPFLPAHDLFVPDNPLIFRI